MHLSVPAWATLADLDEFLRLKWMEPCCDHVSKFRIKDSYYIPHFATTDCDGNEISEYTGMVIPETYWLTDRRFAEMYGRYASPEEGDHSDDSTIGEENDFDIYIHDVYRKCLHRNSYPQTTKNKLLLYEYDMSSTTHVTCNFLGTTTLPRGDDIVMLSRNNLRSVPCERCHSAPVKYIVPIHSLESESASPGALCEACAEINGGEFFDFSLNTPRRADCHGRVYVGRVKRKKASNAENENAAKRKKASNAEK